MQPSRRTKLIIIVSSSLFALFVAAVLFIRFVVARIDGGLSAAIADARAAGVPWTASDLKAPKESSGANNAAMLIWAVADGRAKTKAYLEKENRLLAALYANDYSLMKQALKDLSQDLKDAHTAASKSECTFDRDWDYDPWLPSGPYLVIRRFVMALCASAEVHGYDGDCEEAIAELQTANRLNSFLLSEPTTSAFYRYYYNDFEITYSIEILATAWANSRQKLEMLLKFSEENDKVPEVSRLVIDETFSVVSATRNMSAAAFIGLMYTSKKGRFPKYLKNPPKDIVRDGAPRSVLIRSMLRCHFLEWTKIAKWCQSHRDPLDQCIYIYGESKNEAKKPFAHLINRVVLPKLDAYLMEAVYIQTMRRVRVQFIKSLIFHQEHGRFPNCPDEAGPALLDPFTGEALRQDLDNHVYRVYSVGPDRHDDLGKRTSDLPPSAKTGWDIPLIYPRPMRNVK